MDAGYIVGPRDVMIFTVLDEFVEGVERDTCCHLVPAKCKFYSPDSTTWEDINTGDRITESLKHMQEGIPSTAKKTCCVAYMCSKSR
jgi:hypothetical protein